MELLTGWYFTELTHYDWLMVNATVSALIFSTWAIALIRSK